MNVNHPEPPEASRFHLSRRSLSAVVLIFGLLVTSLVNFNRYFSPEKLIPKLLDEDRELALDNATRYLNSFACLLADLPRDQVIGFWSPIVGDNLTDNYMQFFRMAQYAVAPVRLDAVGVSGTEAAPGRVEPFVFDAVGIDSIDYNSEADYPLIIAFTPDNLKSSLSPLPGYSLVRSCGGGIYLVEREGKP